MKMTFRPIDTWPGDLLDVNDRTQSPFKGFPDWTPAQFIDFYCRTFKVTPETIVTRIEWRYLEP